MIALLGLATVALALGDPVTLKSNPVDIDGQVTLGDVFDGAGAASGMVVGRRAGPSVVFDAGQLQAQARQAGLDWANPDGLRRVVVRHAAVAPATTPALEATAVAASAPARAAPVRPSHADRVISRNDIVEVAYEAGGVRLTISGRAEGNAAIGQRLAIRNLQSNRVFDAVAVGPGLALAGPNAATVARQQFAVR